MPIFKSGDLVLCTKIGFWVNALGRQTSGPINGQECKILRVVEFGANIYLGLDGFTGLYWARYFRPRSSSRVKMESKKIKSDLVEA